MKIKVIFLYIGLFVFLSNAFAQTVEIDGIAYNLSLNLTASVTSKNSYYSGDITIPSTVTYNGINYSVTSIGDEAFEYCRGLTSITIPNSVTSIGDYVFYGCRGLTSITIPNSVTSIGNFAFGSCSGLTSVTIPNSVTSIGTSAFENCRGLTSITIPNSVTSIGNSAFGFCVGLTSIIVELGNSVYDSRNNCNAIIQTSTNELIAGCKNTVIPNSVTSIGDDAFSGCDSLTSINIPNSVTSIGNFAFWSCDSLTSITIPNSVTSIGGSAFGGCAGLTSIIVELGNSEYDSRNNCNAIIETSTNKLIAGCKNTVIPNSVTSIEDRAFYGCRGLTSITIPNSVTSIGYQAFSWCESLTSITIPNSVTSIGDDAFFYCSGLTSVNLVTPSSITEFGYNAFDNTPWLTNQPDGVVYLGDVLYSYKGSMPQNTSVIVNSGTKAISSSAFSGCSGLTSITIPNSVTSIGSSAFRNCSGLTSVIIGNSVTSIGEWAFEGCSGLTSITIPNSVTNIGSSAFRNCSGLTSVIIGNSVTSIGNRAFSDCSGLTSITIPNSVTSIGYSAFSGCSGLTSVIIGNSVTSIGTYAFQDCVQLTSITCEAKTPPYCDTYFNSFENIPANCTIKVPCGCLEAYNRAPWYNYQLTIVPPPSLQVQPSNESLGSTKIDQEVDCDSTAIVSATANYGYHFVQWTDSATSNPRTIKLTQDTLLTAMFAKNSYKITTQSTVSQVCAISAPMQAEYLDTVEIVVSILNPSYRFRYWNDGNTENPRSVVLTQDTAFTATVNNLYVLSGVSEHGIITGAGDYPYGSYVMLAVIPDQGYKFLRWSDGTIYNPYSLVLEKDLMVEAIMEPVASEVDEHESDDHSATKIMKDGAIYIIKNGQMYNLYGTLIEGTE